MEGLTHVEESARTLAGILQQEGLFEVSLETEQESLRLRRRRPAAPIQVCTTASEVLEPEEPEEPDARSQEELAVVPITSQVVGTVHLFDPRAGDPVVRAGQRVHTGQVLLFLESMGLNHEIRCPVDGDILEILVHEREPVEFGQALLLVQPI